MFDTNILLTGLGYKIITEVEKRISKICTVPGLFFHDSNQPFPADLLKGGSLLNIVQYRGNIFYNHSTKHIQAIIKEDFVQRRGRSKHNFECIFACVIHNFIKGVID